MRSLSTDNRFMDPFSLAKGVHTPENAPDDKGVSHSAECDQRRCLWTPPPFEKGGRKLLFCPPATRLYAVGEQCPASSWYCRKLPTGNFSGTATANRKFVKTLSIAKGFHTFLNALSRIKSSARCGVRQGRCPLESHNFLKKIE